MPLVVENRVQSWLTGLPVGAARPAPPQRTVLDASALRAWVGPLALILATPVLSIAFWMACAHHEGSLLGLREATLAEVPRPSLFAVAVIAGWTAFQWALLVLLPGKEILGPVTPAGVQPRYRDNGIAAWIVTHGALVGAWLAGLDLVAFYRHFGELLATLTLFAFGFCLFLYWKGRTFPSSPDAVWTGQPLFDFFQGVELHPRMFGTSLKQLINCRVSMMGWSAIVVAFALAQIDLHGSLSTSMAAAATVLVLYLLKFFWWEAGYFASIDIMHDRFGYYLCWGVLVWVPAVYCLFALWLVDHPIALHPLVALAIVALGAVSIWINYDADAQRQRVRATNGQTTVWGKPPELLVARYTPADGVERQSLLLASGWWGVARHFHYVPELMVAVAWSLPAGFTHVLPWVYPVFLFVLLMDRARRDEKRCAAKYGPDWQAYAAKVPWRVLPGVY